jgi:hypothetical protein
MGKKKPEPTGVIKASESAFLQKVAKEFSITPDKQKWLDAVAVFNAQDYGGEELAYVPGQLVQCTFPHDDPGDVPIWSRSTPWLTVSIRPGYKTDPKTRQQVCVGYPFGTVPRLLMFHIMTEVEHKKNRTDIDITEKRTIHLGKSFAAFLRNIGMNPDNGSGKRSDRNRCEMQVERTVLSFLSFDRTTAAEGGGTHHSWLNMPVSSRGEFFWSLKRPDQGTLWESYIVLSEELYGAIIASPVPLDYIAIRALKDSALHLDLYAWCLYRAHLLSKGKKAPLIVPWKSFMMQLGTSYKLVRQFRAKVKKELPNVTPFLRHLTVRLSDKGVEIHPPKFPVIPPRQLQSGQ